MKSQTLPAALVLSALLVTVVPVMAASRATLEAALAGEKATPDSGDPDGSGYSPKCVEGVFCEVHMQNRA